MFNAKEPHILIDLILNKSLLILLVVSSTVDLSLVVPASVTRRAFTNSF
uniref:Uncharacterized protein n=1 Tax=Arundo donax TaxID=35708 RepID=A0A0A9E892_ARUDO